MAEEKRKIYALTLIKTPATTTLLSSYQPLESLLKTRL